MLPLAARPGGKSIEQLDHQLFQECRYLGLSGSSATPPPGAADGAPVAIITVVTAKRLDRDQFFGAVSELDQDRLQKALWNLCWRRPIRRR
jgi:hypothetical protein